MDVCVRVRVWTIAQWRCAKDGAYACDEQAKKTEVARVRSCIAGALCVVLVIKKCYGEGYVLC